MTLLSKIIIILNYDTHFVVVVSFVISLVFSVVVFWLWFSSVLGCDSTDVDRFSDELDWLSDELELSAASISSGFTGSSSFWDGSSIFAVVVCSVEGSVGLVLEDSAEDWSWSARFLDATTKKCYEI